jgi:5-hydroxyisourate hydrolase
MSEITTHVLDIALGKPAAAVSIRLDKLKDNEWTNVGESATDGDGRCRGLAPEAACGTYRLIFGTGAYLVQMGRTSIYPEISITFTCDGEAHYHLPLLLSDNGYTTYRGS